MSIGHDELKSLVGCGKSWAEERALMALEFADQHAKGELSVDEYKELLEDLVRSDKLDREADDMALKAALVAGVKGLLMVV